MNPHQARGRIPATPHRVTGVPPVTAHPHSVLLPHAVGRGLARSVLRFLPFLLFFLPLSPAGAQTPAELFDEANTAFAQAASQLKSDRPAADRLLDQSIDLYRRIIDAGLVNGRLDYNIGNAYMLKGDVGRAILHYRRAERLIGGRADLASNLAYARQRVATRVESSPVGALRRTLLFWHDDLSPRARWTAFIAAFGGFWAVALARLLALVRFRTRWLLASLAFVAGALAASLAATHAERGARSEAVVVADRVTGRKGPDENGYEPSFKEPLSAGVEVRIVEERPGWLLVRLRDGRETWLPAASVDRV